MEWCKSRFWSDKVTLFLIKLHEEPLNPNGIANENSVYKEREKSNVRNTSYVMNLREQNIFTAIHSI